MSKDINETVKLSQNPEEAYAVHAKDNVFAVTPYFYVPKYEAGDDPGKVYDPSFSRVSLAIIKPGEGSVSANIKYPNGWEIISAKFHAALTMDMLSLAMASTNNGDAGKDSAGDPATPFSDTSGPACTVLMTGKYKDRTAASIVVEEDGVEQLRLQRNFLEKNLAKYHGNKAQIDAIDQAIKLKEEGKLSGAEVKKSASGVRSREIILYSHELHGNDRKLHETDKTKCFVSDCSISYCIGKNYPVKVAIKNYYAPINKKKDGRQSVLANQAIDMKQMEFTIAADDFAALLSNVEDRKHLFLYSKGSQILRGIDEVLLANKAAYEAGNATVSEEPSKKVVESSDSFTGVVTLTGKTQQKGERMYIQGILQNKDQVSLLFEDEAKKPAWFDSILSSAATMAPTIEVSGRKRGNVVKVEHCRPGGRRDA